MLEKTLLKALIEAGAGSRRRVAAAIMQGKVKVNDKTVDDLKHPVSAGKDRVSIDGSPVDLAPAKTVCLALHKPAGVLSTTGDERGRRTVLDILPERYRGLGLYPAGRLDKDTTGLLLLTNDGDLTYRLTHPKFEHEKEYLVHIDSSLTPAEKNTLKRGILLEDGKTSPARIKRITAEPYNYSIIIHEGRKRQVRRMFEHLKHPVLALKRVRIGGLELGDIPEGKVRELGRKEIDALLRH